MDRIKQFLEKMHWSRFVIFGFGFYLIVSSVQLSIKVFRDGKLLHALIAFMIVIPMVYAHVKKRKDSNAEKK